MSCCANSQSVTLFAQGNRASGTEEVIFDTKQAEKIYYFRNIVDPDVESGIVTIEANIGSAVVSPEQMFDGDLITNGAVQTSDNTDFVTLRFNFGNVASRTLALLFRHTSASGLNVTARWASSDLVFSSDVAVPSSTTLSEVPFSFGTQNLQYIELDFTSVTNDFEQSIIHALVEVDSVGDSNVNIQVQNIITGTWHTVDTLSTVLIEETEVLDTKTEIQPNNSLTRIQLVNDVDWVGSVGALLVDPKFNT